MCGIFGEFNVNKTNLIDKHLFIKLNELNFLRGPDSGGYWSDQTHCQLGFRRLAILDLRAEANQPMQSANGKWAMVFNGEVYNHLELRKLLPSDKYIFKTHSDTETILNLFDHLGPNEAVKLFDGMFAIALYNLEERKLFLMRDFAGIKPLFYGIKNGALVFGSQFDLIYHHPEFKQATINPEVLKTYIQYHYIPAPLGLLNDTYQLNPGEILVADVNGNINKSTYWEFPKYNEHTVEHENEALEIIDHELNIAVKNEMLSDVPLGTFLSGGIDSPLITYYGQQFSKSPLEAFSIGSDSQIHDESEDAEWYAKNIGVEHHLEKMNAGYALSMLDKVIESLKEPLADFSIIPTYLVCQFARKNVTVALSGDGGDELFFGYERFNSVLKNLPFMKLNSFSRKIIYGYDKIFYQNKNINDNVLNDNLCDSHAQLHSRFRVAQVNKIFPSLINTQISSDFKAYKYQNKSSETEMLHEMAKAEFYGMMQKTLAKVDRASMSNSLEVRVPFLQKSFIEKSMSINPYLSYGNNKKKDLLKKLLTQKTTNPPIGNTKRGFSIPLGNWIREDLKEVIWESISSKNFITTYDINLSELSQLYKLHQENKVDAKWQIFTLYVLAEWKKRMDAYKLI